MTAGYASEELERSPEEEEPTLARRQEGLAQLALVVERATLAALER
jgi:hypothetical protein